MSSFFSSGLDPKRPVLSFFSSGLAPKLKAGLDDSLFLVEPNAEVDAVRFEAPKLNAGALDSFFSCWPNKPLDVPEAGCELKRPPPEGFSSVFLSSFLSVEAPNENAGAGVELLLDTPNAGVELLSFWPKRPPVVPEEEPDWPKGPLDGFAASPVLLPKPPPDGAVEELEVPNADARGVVSFFSSGLEPKRPPDGADVFREEF